MARLGDLPPAVLPRVARLAVAWDPELATPEAGRGIPATTSAALAQAWEEREDPALMAVVHAVVIWDRLRPLASPSHCWGRFRWGCSLLLGRG